MEKNIFFISQWYPFPESPIGGIFVREHARAIAKFHKVFVVVNRGSPDIPFARIKIDRDIDGPLTVFRIHYRTLRIPWISLIPRLVGTHRVYQQLIQNGLRPDIIHANIYNTADLAVILGKLFNCPAVLTEHSSAFPRKLLTPAQLLKARFFLRYLHMILPVSGDLCEHMKACGIHGAFQSIPNTVDTDIFYPGKSKFSDEDGIPHILVVAMHLPIKNIDLLLNSAANLLGKGLKFKLLLVGDGPERDHLEKLSIDLKITSVTTFLGVKSKMEVAELMRKADMLAITSLWENQPAVLIEAMASGLPVLASRIGGIPEIVQPYCGQLFTPGDISSITETFEGMLSQLRAYSPLEISEYAANRFSYDAVGSSYSRVYQEILGSINHG